MSVIHAVFVFVAVLTAEQSALRSDLLRGCKIPPGEIPKNIKKDPADGGGVKFYPVPKKISNKP